MIHYKDRTFCVSPGCTKPHALTPEIEAAAERAGLPISMAYLCDCQWHDEGVGCVLARDHEGPHRFGFVSSDAKVTT